MNKLNFIAVLFAFSIVCSGCDNEPEKVDIVGIADISFENYPKVDGSTSSGILNTMVACTKWFTYG